MSKELFYAPEGARLIISHLKSGEAWLGRMGFIPNAPITLLTKSGCGVTVRLRGIKYAVSRDLARVIFVDSTGQK